MVVLRMSRQGSKKRPFYRIVAADKRRARDGRFIDLIGTFDPRTKAFAYDAERYEHWVKVGAQPSETLASLVRRFKAGAAARQDRQGLIVTRTDDGAALDIADLVRYIAKGLVDKPDEVHVALVEERQASVYELEVAESDLGKIIGRGGKTARALRTLVTQVAPRSKKRILVEILE
jgi:ribosomal protein S16